MTQIRHKAVREEVEKWWVEKHFDLLGDEAVPTKTQVRDLIARVEEIVAEKVFDAAREIAYRGIDSEWNYETAADYLSTLTEQENGGQE